MAIDRNEQYDPKMFFSLFSHRMPNSISVTYLISPFFIENVKDIRLFQIERMLTQAISVCRWSWKEDWAEFLIHHSTLAGPYYYSIKLLSLWTRVQSLMIFLLYTGTTALVCLCANLVVLSGVNKKPSAC